MLGTALLLNELLVQHIKGVEHLIQLTVRTHVVPSDNKRLIYTQKNILG